MCVRPPASSAGSPCLFASQPLQSSLVPYFCMRRSSIRNRRCSNGLGPRVSGCCRCAPELSPGCPSTIDSLLGFRRACAGLSSINGAFSSSEFFLDGAGTRGVPWIALTRSLSHRSSIGTRKTVRHRTASPDGAITMCSPVRLTWPTHTALMDFAVSFLFCFAIILPARRVANFASTTSPISSTGRCHLVPVRRSHAVMPS